MSWRHVMTSQNLIYYLPISACRCARKLILFFISMVWWANKFKNVINYLLVWGCYVTTSCHDVTIPDVPISACRCARKVIFFVSMVFWVTEFENVIEFYLFNVMTSWRHIMTSQTLIYLSQLVDVLEKWLFFCFHVFWVIEFKTVNDFLFIWCRHVMMSCHDVTKSASFISACGWARTMILFMIP